MSYQRGSIRKSHSGERWILRYRVTAADGHRVENNATIGLVRDFPKERDAWREVDRRGILAAVNAEKKAGRVHFEELAEFYLKAEHGADAVREKSATTIPVSTRKSSLRGGSALSRANASKWNTVSAIAVSSAAAA